MRELEELIVDREVGLRLKEIADVHYGEPLPTYRRRLNGEPAVAFSIQRASGANVVDVSRGIQEVLDEIERDPALEGIEVVLFFDQAEQITSGLSGLLWSGLIGSILALGVLFVFLRRISTTLVISVAIPLSIISTCVFLYLSNRSLNVLTMMGLMLATGMLVDNAIVVLESIFRKQSKGGDPLVAASEGTREVGRAVVAATLTSICVFAPVILTPSSEIAVWLGEVGYTIIVGLVFSLLVSLTLVPLMMGRFLRPKEGEADKMESLPGPLLWLRRRYVAALRWTAVGHPKMALLLTLLTVVVTAGLAKVTGVSLSDEDDRGEKQEALSFETAFDDNVNIYGVERYVERLEGFLLAQQDSLEIESVYMFYTDNTLFTRLYFESGTVAFEELRDLRQYLRDALPVMPGSGYQFDNEEMSGGAQSVTVTLFGDDTEYLAEFAEEARRRIALVDGIEDVSTDADDGQDEVQVRLRPDESGRFDVSPRNLAEILNLTFRGSQVAEYKGPDREVPIGIILQPSNRRSIENLRSMVVSRHEGQDILLDQVADFEVSRSPGRIFREGRRTALPVTATYEGEEYDEALNEVSSLMSSLDMPEGYGWSFGREFLRQQEEKDEMVTNILLALCCVYFVMASLFESFAHPLVIMLCIPFAFLGVVWMGILTDTPINILAMIGVVILIGVVVNNGIILIDHINTHRRSGKDRDQAILIAGEERFRPILMTALTTILGLVPLAFGQASIGNGYYFPMARAVMAGLAASTVLTLLVLPTFYVLQERQLLWIRTVWAKGTGKLPGTGWGGALGEDVAAGTSE
jgi:HAE1 family hydrophobic/amphiphilic exporter-1